MQSWLDIGVIHKNKRGALRPSFIGVHACAVWCARYFFNQIFCPSLSIRLHIQDGVYRR